MVNMFKWTRIMSYGIAAFIPLIILVVALLLFKYSLMTATVCAIVGVLGSVFVGRILGGHPWISSLEGKGIWVFDIGSPGFLTPGIAEMTDGKNILIKTASGNYISLFNRAISFYFKKPVKAVIEKGAKSLSFSISKEEYTASNFAFNDQPVFIWNSKTKCLLTKEALGVLETKIMTEHLALLELEQQRELSRDIHGLNRSFFDMLRPSALMDLIQNPLVMAIVVICGVGLILMFAAPQIENFLGITKSAGSVLTPAVKQGATAISQKASTMALDSISGWVF